MNVLIITIIALAAWFTIGAFSTGLLRMFDLIIPASEDYWGGTRFFWVLGVITLLITIGLLLYRFVIGPYIVKPFVNFFKRLSLDS